MATAQQLTSKVTAADIKAALAEEAAAKAERERFDNTDHRGVSTKAEVSWINAEDNATCLRLCDAREAVRSLLLRAADLPDEPTSSAVIMLDGRALAVFARSRPNEDMDYDTISDGYQQTTKVVRLD